jgi:hypothetical protein
VLVRKELSEGFRVLWVEDVHERVLHQLLQRLARPGLLVLAVLLVCAFYGPSTGLELVLQELELIEVDFWLLLGLANLEDHLLLLVNMLDCAFSLVALDGQQEVTPGGFWGSL